jgi:hypothetical protein
MFIGRHEFDVYFAVVIVMFPITVFVPVWRLYVLRHRTYNIRTLLAELFYGFSWIINVVIHTHDLVESNRERQIRQTSTSEIEVELRVVTTSFLKVCTH